MNFEHDEECTADYGVFGSNACNCSSCRGVIPVRDEHAERAAARLRKKRENERKVSSDFNRYMIDFFNARSGS